MNSVIIFRWIHILAAGVWLGEVVVINIILVPVLARLDPDKRGWFMAAIFPRIFQLASIVVATVLLSGAALNLSMSAWDLGTAVSRLAPSRWGTTILIAGLLGLALGLFHFFAEGKLEPRILEVKDSDTPADFDAVVRHLKIIPRVGLGILFVIFILMMYAARGF